MGIEVVCKSFGGPLWRNGKMSSEENGSPSGRYTHSIVTLRVLQMVRGRW